MGLICYMVLYFADRQGFQNLGGLDEIFYTWVCKKLMMTGLTTSGCS